jgi:hypothetical protein
MVPLKLKIWVLSYRIPHSLVPLQKPAAHRYERLMKSESDNLM